MDRLSYGPYLYALEPDVLAVLTMHGELHKPWLWLHANGFGCMQLALAACKWLWLHAIGFGCMQLALAACNWLRTSCETSGQCSASPADAAVQAISMV